LVVAVAVHLQVLVAAAEAVALEGTVALSQVNLLVVALVQKVH
jgi:hypothetical protein